MSYIILPGVAQSPRFRKLQEEILRHFQVEVVLGRTPNHQLQDDMARPISTPLHESRKEPKKKNWTLKAQSHKYGHKKH